MVSKALIASQTLGQCENLGDKNCECFLILCMYLRVFRCVYSMCVCVCVCACVRVCGVCVCVCVCVCECVCVCGGDISTRGRGKRDRNE